MNEKSTHILRLQRGNAHCVRRPGDNAREGVLIDGDCGRLVNIRVCSEGNLHHFFSVVHRVESEVFGFANLLRVVKEILQHAPRFL